MARKLCSCFIIRITRLSNNYQLSTTHTHISEQKWQTCIASAVQYDGHQRNFIIRLNRIIIFITTATPCNHYLISTRHQQLCAAECDHSHCGLMQNVYKPRETSAVLSLRTTTRKHSSATGYGAARRCSTTYYCGGSKSATGVAVYGKLVGMWENYGRLSLIYRSLRQLPLITFQPNSSQLWPRTRWTLLAIRSSMAGSSALTSSQSCPTLLHCYSPITTSVIARVLGQSPNKQCSLDPCPTRLVKSLNNAGHS